MNAITIESLGLTKEDLAERVVERAVEQLLSGVVQDEDGEPHERPSAFAASMQAHIKQAIDAKIASLAEAYVLPRVTDLVENITMQETNRWGEKTGKSMSFIEYLVARADAYLREDVNYEGKGKDEAGGFGWSKSQTRITHLVHKHLAHSIENAMKAAVLNVNNALAGGLQETVKIKLGEILAKLKVEVKA